MSVAIGRTRRTDAIIGAVRFPLRSLLFVVASSAALAACSSEPEGPRTLLVPADYPTIQQAVDEARSGDLVLIDAGTYHEEVIVTEDEIVIRGIDRNTVVLDGRDELANGIQVASDGVAVENLTLRAYTQNGVIFNGALMAYEAEGGYDGEVGTGDQVVDGYRVSYVTAANNGLYGIYAFGSRDGLIEHSFASGSTDSGIYVGQCKPCNVVIRDVIAELNAIGYYGTNASGEVYIVESVFRRNRLGLTPNSQDAEMLAPQEETVVAANLVVDNDDPAAPAIGEGYFGVGIAVGGGTKNLVVGNRVEGHDGAGIALVRLGEFDPIGNSVTDNVFAGNTVDLVYDVPTGEPLDNCFGAHPGASTLPAGLTELMPCGATLPASVPVGEFRVQPGPPDIDYRTIPLPPEQPTMPDAATAPARPARDVFQAPDLTKLVVPKGVR